MAKRYMNGELQSAMAKSEPTKIRVQKHRALRKRNRACVTVQFDMDFLRKIHSILVNENITESEFSDFLQSSDDHLRLVIEAICIAWKCKGVRGPNGSSKYN